MRKEIKDRLMEQMQAAKNCAEAIKKDPALSEEETIALVHRYICRKFMLEETESAEMSLRNLSQKSIEKAVEMNIPIAKESERASTCGAAGTVEMKIALLFMALRKDLELDLSPTLLGRARNTRTVGQIVYEENRKRIA